MFITVPSNLVVPVSEFDSFRKKKKKGSSNNFLKFHNEYF